ncbi:sulfate adenylyltransferase [Candidatus Hakubella thermalkaliphila]|uniref:Sulfate adenylyltransferase n=3 Tax=Candidatus Hakubella thermalkaliphila TaxID=2754717 RepID=A0A6V8PCZ6_9ACTN|nr:sulfate adenylyltransferase [Candidatus Hakubella thermalkaliphila]GFP29514.1 sulfate adenylyltransferase [Candidatus Hakubella thermalkaliphila]GFP39724.1 sulfate adenylyltransferase [Candidatus Hakubella thermalkaliphila]
MKETITPHGGNLINREIAGDEKAHLDQRVKGLKKIRLDSRQISDVEMIAVGAFSPLEGFIRKEDYHSILHNMRLKNGLPWTIPIILAVIKDEAKGLKEGEDIALQDGEGEILAVLHLEEKYLAEKDQEALQVYGTQDAKHPGVAYLYQSGEVLLGGRISLLRRSKHTQFEKYRFDPKDTRRIFRERGWKRIAGFQTRNPVHRAHEYIQKCALETVDGLLLHPLVGETKADDIPAEVRMQCYEVLLENYYPKDRVFMAVLPAAMRYAGPKEAIFHAIVRKNYGCTHFIVGRDHAGVGDYYGSFDAHYIFDEFSPDELGITPLFFDFTFYCRRCGQMTSNKTCPHLSQDHVSLSGTKVREMLRRGEVPPPEFTRPEIAAVLIEWARAQKEEYHS